ncbi:MAG: xanthine dehydrogenase family protein molybdopterin-binding subunit [Chloroflexi bacterium]|nr:xanthine dehydrogenase family protein molybdopterin-binding subunit [Chloroflexota bacterium]
MVEHRPSEPGTGIGAPLRRRETERFIQGAGTYADDVQLPNQAYAAFVRSFHAHARITGIDPDALAAARALPGVLGVFTEENWGDVLGARGPWPLAKGKVYHVGQPIAVAVAETRSEAQDAASAVVVHYEPLPALTDPEAAMQPDAPRLFEDMESNVPREMHLASDGLDDVFAGADHVVKARLQTSRIQASPIEPRAMVASYDAINDEATIWIAAKVVHGVRSQAARTLGLPETKVRVIAPDIGGAFGGKGGYGPEEVMPPVLARHLRRPVKWTEMRTEALATANHGRDLRHDIELALRSDGRILGLRDRIVGDTGADARGQASVTAAFLYMTGPYDIQDYGVDACSVATNKTAHGSVRGIGKADAAFCIERTMDIAARELGIDPAEIRLKNFVPEEKFPYLTPTGATLDSGRYAECLKMALDLAGYAELRKEQAALQNRPALRRGIGISFVIEPTGAARRGSGGGYGACRLKVELSGAISAYPAGGAQGQGHKTTVSQIVADRLGCLPENVQVFMSDTLVTPNGAGAGSSRTSQTVMPAVLVAANKLREKILRIAGHRLGMDPRDLRLEKDVIRGAERQITLREVIQIAYQDVDRLPPGEEPALEVTGYFINENHVYDFDEKGRRNEFSTYPYDATVAVVDVDIETGQTEVVKYVSVHDCGTMINPRIVATQHVGAIAQGIGAALFEEMRYDEEGKLLTGTFMDYLLPTAHEIPLLVLGHMETPTPFTPLGAKGAGETGTISAPCAIGNAIEDAIGVPVRQPPYTPERVLRAIQAGRAIPTGGASRG